MHENQHEETKRTVHLVDEKETLICGGNLRNQPQTARLGRLCRLELQGSTGSFLFVVPGVSDEEYPEKT